MSFQAIRSEDLAWSQAEHSDDPQEQAVVVAGYELSIAPDPEIKKQFSWIVKMTSEISETPEVVDTGVAKSEGGARIYAKEALNRDRRRRAKAEREQQDSERKIAKEMAQMTVRQQEPQPKQDLAEKQKARVDKNLAAAKRSRKTKAAEPEAVAA